MWFALSMAAAAQSGDDLYKQACGPKQAQFTVKQMNGSPAAAVPGKALVYVIQKESGILFTTRVGLDGNWSGVIQGDSYIPLSVTPGEHHLCATTQDRKNPIPELLHIRVEAGKTYYVLVRASWVSTDTGRVDLPMSLTALDIDEARYLIATDTQSVATQKR